MNNRH